MTILLEGPLEPSPALHRFIAYSELISFILEADNFRNCEYFYLHKSIMPRFPKFSLHRTLHTKAVA